MKTLVGLSTAALLSIGLMAAPAQADYQPNPSTETRAVVTRTESTIKVVTSGGRKVRGTVIVRIIDRETGNVVRRNRAALEGGRAVVGYPRLANGRYKMVIKTDAVNNRFDDLTRLRFGL